MSITKSTASYLRPRELADLLGLTTRTLCRWRAAGRGPTFIREGRIVRYRTEDVDLWARSH